jgi:hypothetical protein
MYFMLLESSCILLLTVNFNAVYAFVVICIFITGILYVLGTIRSFTVRMNSDVCDCFIACN